MPKRRNLVFYATAAAAQLAGFRACKRCLPDASPGSPLWHRSADAAARAMALIADGLVDREGVAGLARRLALSERHLHRVLVEAVGAPPLALARAQRARTARTLIEQTELPFTEIAFASGFSSIRQFNETIRQVYADSPTSLRRAVRRGRPGEPDQLVLRLALRRPFDGERALTWLSARAVPGVESVDGVYRRVLRLPGGPAVVELAPGPDHVEAAFELDSIGDLASAVGRCRRLLDLDADPRSVDDVLRADRRLAKVVAAWPGQRAFGSVDGAETALRAVVGQGLSPGAARALAAALAVRLGTPLGRSSGTLTHAFPEPAAVAEADLAAGLGLAPARLRTLRELARRLAAGTLAVDPGADREEARRRLLEIPGIGESTATIVLMRALGDPDAFPAADPALVRAARELGLASSPRELATRARRWRPWRSYAAHHLWLAVSPSPAAREAQPSPARGVARSVR
jgi:AraC family transcriptional regulator of adaptative response / DNA-3-methyladenine glycosylase II